MTAYNIRFGQGITIGNGVTAGSGGGGGGGGSYTTPTGSPTSLGDAAAVFEMGLWTSGTTVPDISVHSNTFTLSNASAGNSQYYSFNGSTYATADNSSIPTDGATAMTLMGWFAIPSFSGNITLISRNNGGAGWGLRVDSSGSQINLVKYNDRDQPISLNTALTANDWHFISVSQTGTSLVYVIDGTTYTHSGSGGPFVGIIGLSAVPVRLAYDMYGGGNIQPAQAMREVRIIDNVAYPASTLAGIWSATKAAYGY
jgi:hypothetical protein